MMTVLGVSVACGLLCLACYLLGNAIGYIIGFRAAANDVVLKQLKELENSLIDLGTPIEADGEHDLVLVRLNKDQSSEPVN